MSILKVAYGPDPSQAHVPPSMVLKVVGPALMVVVGQPSAAGSAIAADPADKSISALIDTGATDSCIDTAFATQLGLRVIDRRPVGGVAGQQIHDVFLGKIIVPELQMAFNGSLIGVQLGGGHQIILGRDFLVSIVMIYDGTDGRVTFCR